MSEKKAIHKFKAGDVFDERYILEKLMGSGGSLMCGKLRIKIQIHPSH